MSARARPPVEPVLTVQVEAPDDVSDVDRDYARATVAALGRRIGRPVLYARVRLTVAHDRAVPRPYGARAQLDVDGRPLRAHASAESAREAVDALDARLRDRLERLLPDWESLRGGLPSKVPGEWRHGSEPAERADWFPRPAEERRLIKRKSFALPAETPDEAAFSMEMLDDDFHLFTDVEFGSGFEQDALLSRADPPAYRLALLDPPSAPAPTQPCAVPLLREEQPAPTLTLAQAIEHLELAGEPFVFYRSTASDRSAARGAVLYHRYDGHYGLVVPAQ
ncbi:MAG TPA: sigma 54 modulation/S30EA ribosomal C-terminal domain-containing protein [Motilibacteraceae bacterium]|nr:sigma 54 modulation/S30EA ribosomal C-terminal domain-containing protein [Motilibacteraceae bacterium]